MLTEGKYQLYPLSGDSITPEASRLLLDLAVSGTEFYRIDNLKGIGRPDPPILVRGRDGRMIKIRWLPSEKDACTVENHLGDARWPYGTAVLGRCGRALAEAWVEGLPVSDDRYIPDRISGAGAALGRLHALPSGNADARWARADYLVSATRDRIRALAAKGFVGREACRRLLRVLDHHAPDRYECGIAHGDFAPDNLLIDAHGRLVCIDNETVRIDALDYDLARTILRWPLMGVRRRAFLAAYSAHRDPRPTAHQAPYWLLSVLSRASQWQRERFGAPSEETLRWLHRLAATERAGATRAARPLAQAQHELRVTFLGARIDVVSDDEGLLAWLAEFLTPQFTTGPDAQRDHAASWRVDMRTSEAEYREHETACAPRGRPPIRAFLRDEGWDDARDCGTRNQERLFFSDVHDAFYGVDVRNRRIRIYGRRDNPMLRLAAMKAVRELAMREGWRAGRLMIHAAALVTDRDGCLILGPKGAGKTTLLTYLLQSSAAHYLTNDRAVVVRSADGLLIHGIPTIVSLRTGTTGFFPVLREGQKRRGYRQLQTLDEALAAGVSATLPEHMIEHPDLAPAQYRAHLGCTASLSAHLAAVLVPAIRTSRDGLGPSGFSVTRLDAAAARKALDDGRFGPAAGWPGGDMIPPDAPVAIDPADQRDDVISSIIRAVPCFRVDIHATAFQTAELATALRRLANASTTPVNELATS